jgi:hypothetical protein
MKERRRVVAEPKPKSKSRNPVTDGVSIGGARDTRPNEAVQSTRKKDDAELESFEQPAARSDVGAGRQNPLHEPPDGPVPDAEPIPSREL